VSKTKVGIINVTGYAGVELARLLSQHLQVELTSVTGRSAAGQKLGKVFPHLASLDLTIEAESPHSRQDWTLRLHQVDAGRHLALKIGGKHAWVALD